MTLDVAALELAWQSGEAKYDAKLVERVYQELQKADETVSRMEQSYYLERYAKCGTMVYIFRYLLPHYGKQVSQHHTLSVIFMLNEKAKQNLPAIGTNNVNQLIFFRPFQSQIRNLCRIF